MMTALLRVHVDCRMRCICDSLGDNERKPQVIVALTAAAIVKRLTQAPIDVRTRCRLTGALEVFGRLCIARGLPAAMTNVADHIAVANRIWGRQFSRQERCSGCRRDGEQVLATHHTHAERPQVPRSWGRLPCISRALAALMQEYDVRLHLCNRKPFRTGLYSRHLLRGRP
jgi:hypothetical protein